MGDQFRIFWRSLFATIALCALEAADSLESGFEEPPESTAPATFWYWASGMISKEGITKDLEAMASIGIGEAYIADVDVNPGHRGPVVSLSEEWWDMVSFAIAEGDRIGINIGLFNGPGWSNSGGPWVAPEESMRYLTQSEVRLTGGQHVEIQLEKPAEHFQEVAMLAFPVSSLDGASLVFDASNVSSNLSFSGVRGWFDGDLFASTAFPDGSAGAGSELEITLRTQGEKTVRTVQVYPEESKLYFEVELYAKASDGSFELVKSFVVDRRESYAFLGPISDGPVSVAIPPVNSDTFRLVFKNRAFGFGGGVREIRLLEVPLLDRFVEKQLGKLWQTPLPEWDAYLWDESDEVSLVVDGDQILDLSEFTNSEGVLNWDVPAGDWLVQWIGMAPTGVVNNPSSPDATGYEVDKLSKRNVAKHFDSFIGKILENTDLEHWDAVSKIVIDSYESGSQNWTDGFEQVFHDAYGYDPIPWLPVLSGRIVESADQSDRFLWDLRRLVADRMSTEYVGGLRDISNRHGFDLWVENYGHWGFPGEFLQYGGQSDEVAGEFWVDYVLGEMELRAATSAAHIYGKQRVSAEAFTAANKHWMHTPDSLRTIGDWAQSIGVNHFTLNVSIHQPDERKPGVNAPFGSEFNRHNTWFGEAKSWIDYLKRSHFLLQQGNQVADVAYFIGEDTPKMTGVLEPSIPDGYNFDFINAEVIMERMEVRDGVFVLFDGQRYRLLVLPPLETMRPEVLERLLELVEAGGAIYGQSPLRSPSLENFPIADRKVEAMSEILWGDGDVLNRQHGEGWVFSEGSIEDVFDQLGVEPDLLGGDQEELLFSHRSTLDAEIYFVTNQSETLREEVLGFRVNGLVPELWDAVTGEVRYLPVYTDDCGRVSVPLEFGAGESLFVVFRRPSGAVFSGAVNFPTFEEVGEIEGAWSVSFAANFGPKGEVLFDELSDWSIHSDPNIRYYSGKAVYLNEFILEEKEGASVYYLDLGEVANMARVVVNGVDLGMLWTSPWRVDISDVLLVGKNELEVHVTNTWANRIIGDQRVAEVDRATWTIHPHLNQNSPLQSSGLIGPVRIQKVGLSRIYPIDLTVLDQGDVSAFVERYASCFGLEGIDRSYDGNPDGDEWTNFAESFFGTDPTRNDSNSEVFRIQRFKEGGRFELEFSRLSTYQLYGIGYSVFYSDDLSKPKHEWQELDLSEAQVYKNLKRDGYDRVVVPLEENQESVFFRALLSSGE